MPLVFRGFASPGSGTKCVAGCDATATIASFGLLLRNGGNRGLRPVFEGFLGATQFTNFEFESAADRPNPEIRNTDFAFAFGTGFGYSLSRDFQLIALYEVSRNVHDRAEQLVGARRITQHYATRVGLRVGI